MTVKDPIPKPANSLPQYRTAKFLDRIKVTNDINDTIPPIIRQGFLPLTFANHPIIYGPGTIHIKISHLFFDTGLRS